MRQPFDSEGAIERYLNGTMSPTEQNEFRGRLERDQTLRRAVDAEMLIRRSVRSERSSMPAPSAAARARFLAMVATVVPESSAPPQPAAEPAGGGSLAGSIAGGGIAKGIIATVAAVTVTIGAIMLLPGRGDRGNTGGTPPDVEIVQPAPKAAPPAISLQPAATDAPEQPATAEPAGDDAPPAAMPDAYTTTHPVHITRSDAAVPEEIPVHSSTAHAAADASSEDAALRTDNRDEGPLPVMTNDSVQVRFDLRKPVIRR